jgi:hypothetical protein
MFVTGQLAAVEVMEHLRSIAVRLEKLCIPAIPVTNA